MMPAPNFHSPREDQLDHYLLIYLFYKFHNTTSQTCDVTVFGGKESNGTCGSDGRCNTVWVVLSIKLNRQSRKLGSLLKIPIEEAELTRQSFSHLFLRFRAVFPACRLNRNTVIRQWKIKNLSCSQCRWLNSSILQHCLEKGASETLRPKWMKCFVLVCLVVDLPMDGLDHYVQKCSKTAFGREIFF